MHEQIDIPSYDVRDRLPIREPSKETPFYNLIAAEIALGVGLVATMHNADKAAIQAEYPPAIIEAAPAYDTLVTNPAALELEYPTSSVMPWDETRPRNLDYEQTTDSHIVYSHEGLEQFTFVAMTEETAEAIMLADTIEEAESLARPVYEAAGIDLHVTDLPDDHLRDFEPSPPEDLPYVKRVLVSLARGIALTPRELIEFSNIGPLYVAKSAKVNGEFSEWGGYADYPDTPEEPGSIGIFAHPYDGEYETWDVVEDLWHHEFGHHLTFTLDYQTAGGFYENYMTMNPSWFNYRDEIEDEDENITESEDRMLQLAADVHVADGGFDNEREDAACEYTNMMASRGAPDPENATAGTPSSYKRIVMLEYIEAFLPGFKEYAIGATTAQDLRPIVAPLQPFRDDFTTQYAPGYRPVDPSETLPGSVMSPEQYRQYQLYMDYTYIPTPIRVEQSQPTQASTSFRA